MLARFALAVAIVALTAALSWAQATPISGEAAVSAWRRAGEATVPASSTAPATDPGDLGRAPTVPDAPPPPANDSGPRHRHPIARVTNGMGSLPNHHGQVWREYDISPYTARVTTTKRPEQAIVDWILRETGYEVWHTEPLGILSATPRTLRVYHTPEMQDVVAEIVDRFVTSDAEMQSFSLRVITLDNPNWRVRAMRVLHPVPVQTPGISAWLLQREDAAVLLAELQRRSDFREHSSPHLLVDNGQTTVVSRMRPRCYVRDLILRPECYPGFEAQTGQIDEGFSLEFSPLLTLDRRLIDAAIKCNIDQVERLVPVALDVPTTLMPGQRTKIEVPQMTHFRFHERFRWPADQVLLIGMGMAPPPVPVDGATMTVGLPLAIGAPPRADLLVVLESRGRLGDGSRVPQPGEREAHISRGRY